MTAVHTPTQEHLRDPEIEPLVKPVLHARDEVASAGTECAPLQGLIDDSDLGGASKEACRKAIDLLLSAFDICHNLDEDDYLQAVSAFSVKIEAGFIDVLRKYRPEALITLAYYGILLHRCRNFWAFCDAGSPVIHSIAGHLGTYWRDALAWPLCMNLNTYRMGRTSVELSTFTLTKPSYLTNRSIDWSFRGVLVRLMPDIISKVLEEQ